MAKDKGLNNRFTSMRIKPVDLDGEDVNPEKHFKRLNTNMRLDLQKHLDQRRVDGHGTKTEQLEKAVEVFLALVGSGGKVDDEMLDAMENLLARERAR